MASLLVTNWELQIKPKLICHFLILIWQAKVESLMTGVSYFIHLVSTQSNTTFKEENVYTHFQNIYTHFKKDV